MGTQSKHERVDEGGPAAPTATVRTRVLRGVMWSYGSLAGGRVLALATTAVLAHILLPRQFGLVAVALIFTTALDSLRDLGLNEALVVAPKAEYATQADTAFCTTVLIGIALALLVGALSPAVAGFFHQPQLFALLAVLGLNVPLRAAGLTHYALAQRRLDFRSRTLAELAEVVARGLVGVPLALLGLGPWSLVLGYLSGTLAWTILIWVLVTWRPSLHVRRSDLSVLLRFGRGVTIVGVIGGAMSYIDNFFVGRVLGAAALGVYSLGYRLPEMLIVDGFSAAGVVLFPAFARLNGPALRDAVLTTSRYAMLFGLPVAVLAITLAQPLVLALFGPRWRDAVPVIQLLSIGFAAGPLGQVIGAAFMATRRVDVMVKLAVPQGLLLLALVAVVVSHGIVAVAGCQAAVRVIVVAAGMVVSTRVLGLRTRELWSVTWPAMIAAGGMAAVIVPVERAIVSPWVALVTSVALGGTVYVGLAWLLARDAVSSLWTLARGARVPVG